eukprot:COSAG01_NODE_47453_length_390_cov_0.711340_1_plen_72_part_00
MPAAKICLDHKAHAGKRDHARRSRGARSTMVEACNQDAPPIFDCVCLLRYRREWAIWFELIMGNNGEVSAS